MTGQCVPKCGDDEVYEETRGGCRPTDKFCREDPDLWKHRDDLGYYDSGYCRYNSWVWSSPRNGIRYSPLYCNESDEFSAEANADTYINTDLVGKDLTIGKRAMCPPTGLFLALGERRREQDNSTDYYHPEWGIESDLENKHERVVVRASGDCTGISDVVAIVNKLIAIVARVELPSGVLAACQAHDYCYDLIRSGLHQTVQEGGDRGCDEVLKQLWISYCGTLALLSQLLCKLDVYTFNAAARTATTSPEAGVVVLRNSQTGKCLTRKLKSTTLVQEHCRFDDNHKPNDEGQWFHVLQSEPFSNAAVGPTEAGYFYVMPANVNPAEKESWKKSLSSQETEVAGSKCLYVDSVSTRKEVREGSCMVSGARSSSRVFRLVNTPAADEYGIRSVGGGCWQPEAEAGGDDAETAADGVSIVSVFNASGCDAVLQWWRIEPVDPTAIVGESS